MNLPANDLPAVQPDGFFTETLAGADSAVAEAIAAELDRAHLQDIRAKLPSLANRQPNAYRWPTRA